MKSRKVVFTTVLALVCVAAFAVTAFAQAAMEGPDESEVYEGGNVDVTFNSPSGGGMEGNVSAVNLTFNEITTNNMGSTLSDEHHVFSLFGDPVTYNYTVSAAAGDEVSVSLTDAEQSDEQGNLTQLQDTTWSATVQATGSASPEPPGTQTPTPDDPSRPTSTLPPIPTIEPSGSPAPGAPGIITDNNNNSNSNNIDSNNNNTINSNNTTTYVAVRYPAYAPRPVYQRTVYRSYDGMPKMGDSGSGMNYWALLTMGALLCVVIIVSATQLYAHSTRGRVDVTILR